jgi:hypothetical protein
MPLPDLFQWIGSSSRSGELRVEHGRTNTRIACRKGRVTSCSSDDPPKLLGQFLLFQGSITEDILRRAMAEQDESGRSLPVILVEMGAVTKEDLDRVVAAKASEAIFGLFDWDDAEFFFDKDESPDPNAMGFDLDVQDLLLRGAERLDDQAQINAIFRDPSMVVSRTDREPSFDLLTDWPTREVYKSIDGKRTIEEITLKVHGTEFLVAKILLRLYHEDLIYQGSLRSENSSSPAEPRSTTEASASNSTTILKSEIAREELLSKIPVPLMPREKIEEAGISAEEDFLLNLSDGTWDVRSLTWVAPMYPADVLAALENLCDRGFLELRDRCGETPELTPTQPA